MGWHVLGRRAGRGAALAALVLALAGCFTSDTRTAVGADGRAVTRLVVEIDVAAYEELLAAVTEDMADVLAGLGGDPGGEDTGPSFRDEIEVDIARLDADLADLYEEMPELRERFHVEADLDDGTLRTEILAVTTEIEHLGLFLDGVLGSGTLDHEVLFGFPSDRLGSVADDFGGGTGIFSTVTSRFEQGRFVFRAEPPASGGFTDDIEVEFARFDDLRPDITLTVEAPGDIVATNGRTEGRVVTWDLDGAETEPVELVAGIDGDPSAEPVGFGDVPTPVDAAGGFPGTTLAVVAIVLCVVGGGAYVLLRRTDEHERAPERPGAGETTG